MALVEDPALFDELLDAADALGRRDLATMERVVFRSAAIHVARLGGRGDPFELGASRPLDFGHWAAHQLEALSGFRLRHGEAVAIGIALDSTYSHLAAVPARLAAGPGGGSRSRRWTTS